MDHEPVTTDRASIPAVPRRRTHHEIIDVDELDDEQDQRPSRRPRRPLPRGNSSREPVSSEIIVLDSDDGSEAGPSTRRRPSGKCTLTLSVVLSSLFGDPEMLGYARRLRQHKSSTLHPQSRLYPRVLINTHMFSLQTSFARTSSLSRLNWSWDLT